MRNSAHNTTKARKATRGEHEGKDPRKVARTRPSQRSLYHGRGEEHQGVGCQGAGTDGTHQDELDTFAFDDVKPIYNRSDPSVCAPWHRQGDKCEKHEEGAQRQRKDRPREWATRTRGETVDDEHVDDENGGTNRRHRDQRTEVSTELTNEQTESRGGGTTIKTQGKGKGRAGQVRSSARNITIAREARKGEATKRTPRKVARTRPSQQRLYHGQGVGCQGAGTDGTHQDWYENLAFVCANLDYDRLGPSVCDPWHLQGDGGKRHRNREHEQQKEGGRGEEERGRPGGRDQRDGPRPQGRARVPSDLAELHKRRELKTRVRRHEARVSEARA